VSERSDEKSELTSGALQLGVELSPSDIARLLRFLDLIYEWNRSAGLTAIPREKAVRLHLVDSLSAVPFVHGRRRVADLGTGAGLPGIPIAIACPDTAVVLVETRRRKASFLGEAVRELGCENCLVHHGKAEDVAKLGLEIDAVIARAFLPPVELVALSAKLVEPGGDVVIMGSKRDAALDASPVVQSAFTLSEDRSFTLPGGDEYRRILVLRHC